MSPASGTKRSIRYARRDGPAGRHHLGRGDDRDPCDRARVYGILVTLPLLALTRFRRALFLERLVFALFLAVMPFVYVAGSLIAGSGTLPVELVGVPIYVTLAILGMKKPILLAAGIVLHGVGWDVWHSLYAGSVPVWYAWACMTIDLGVGAYAFARVRTAYGSRI